MTSTVIGKIDYDGDIARIEGDSVPTRKMISKVAVFLKARPMKGKDVVAQIIEEGDKAGWIEHVQELPLDEKMKKAGFGQPTPGPASAEQKEGEPANPSANTGLKTVEGQITFIDPAAHKITVKDRAGASHTMIWPPALHDKMSQQKQWWFVKITGEHQEDVDIWKLISVEFFKRPDDWPASQHGGGGWKGQPRNERLIAFQNMHTAALQGAQFTVTPDTQDYDAFMDVVYARAKKDTEQAMKDFGGV
jgi:hypothetical protein